jgi:hypothetical protein
MRYRLFINNNAFNLLLSDEGLPFSFKEYLTEDHSLTLDTDKNSEVDPFEYSQLGTQYSTNDLSFQKLKNDLKEKGLVAKIKENNILVDLEEKKENFFRNAQQKYQDHQVKKRRKSFYVV